ncbi:MAG: hypothetical protein LM582_09340 [Desulfurococcaceae archaeon]|jgi:hypothetical protein|nr:hypothetical protein [Desulfurococcaceae archaeon]
MHEEVLKYYATFIKYSGNCSKLVEAALNESYCWLIQSFEKSRSITCSYKEPAHGYEFNCLNDLVKVSMEVNDGSVRIAFRGFVFVPEHASGSEMSLFSIAYELSEKNEKLYFDNPLGDPCKTSEDEAINAFLDTLAKIFKLCEERSL